MELVFSGYLNKLSTVSTNDEPVKSLGVKLVTRDALEVANQFPWVSLTRTFQEPINWEKISFLVGSRVNVKFDSLTFTAMLRNVSVKRKETEEGGLFEFSFTLEKELEPQNDHILSANYLKHKEPDPDTGKLKLVNFEVKFS